jgi:hypothetical protein
MSFYTPDAWHILKIDGYKSEDGPIYKVLAGWYGGYAGSDSWKLNSGITKITDCGDYYDIDGYSGSTYRCYKRVERFTGLMYGMLDHWMANKDSGLTIEPVSIEEALKQF